MNNLELFDVSRKCYNQTVEENVISVHFQDNIIYMLKNQVLLVHNTITGEESEVFHKKFTTTITPLIVLEIEQHLWFATGREAVYIDLADHAVKIVDFEYDFLAAEWNSAQDTLAVVSSSGDVGAYNIDLETNRAILIEKCNLYDTFDSTLISVGWGSSNTQFVGKGRKQSAQTIAGDLEVSAIKDEKPRISWRGNGEMFAVDYFDNGKRLFKTFQYPCELLYQSEDKPGLQSVISWRPEGNLIATVSVRSNQSYLSFFEKNGLFRHEFLLHDQKNVEQVKWSNNSDCIAVLQGDGVQQSLNLYLMKNYVWYLKQQLNFKPENVLLNFAFVNSSSSIYKLLVNTAKECIIYCFRSTLHLNQPTESTPFTCAVINHNNIYLTHCTEGVTPPPLYSNIITTTSAVNFIAFHPKEPKVAAIDSENVVYIYNYNEAVNLIGTFQLVDGDPAPVPLELRMFLWKQDGALFFLQYNGDAQLMKLNLSDNVNDWHADVVCPIGDTINNLAEVLNTTDTVEQRVNDVIIKDGEECKSLITLTVPPLYLKSVKIGNDYFAFSLSENGLFFINDIEIFNNIVSFIIHENYLFLTSALNKLIGFRINRIAIDEICEQRLEHLYSRPIEQGSSLLFGIPNTSCLVLQLPRGNLETIACKMMSVDRIEDLTRACQWHQALDIVRMEKLCTSILVDLNVEHFLANCKNSVECLKSPAVLGDFILGLQEESVFATLYRNCGGRTALQFENKLEQICSELIIAMEEINYLYYCKPIIISCLIADTKHSIKQALEHVRNLLYMAEQETVQMKLVQDALQVIITLKPHSDIYKVALQLYDLDLTIFVARNSQMDPKEFEPFIEDLRMSDDLTCRFKINHFLQNYSIALRYLMRCGTSENDILAYIEQYSLHKEAYNTVGLHSDLFKSISQVYASSLSRKGLYEESGTVYARADFNKEALEAYTRSLNWEEVLLLVAHTKCDNVEADSYLARVCDGLKKQKRPKEASYIYENFLNDYESAINALIDGKCFAAAYSLIVRYKRNDITVAKLIPHLTTHCTQLCEKFKELHETFVKYGSRLANVRLQMQKSAVGPNREIDFQKSTAEDDIYSLADSTISRMSSSSRYSSISSRNRRKEERKKCDLREGGVYEDIALLRALYELYKEAFQYGSDVRDATLTQMQIHKVLPNYVEQTHNSLLTLQLLMKNSVGKIWPQTLNDESNEMMENKAIQKNINLLDVKYRYPPDELNINWKVSILEPIGL